MSALRPVVATSIGAPTSRGDFLDRCVTVRTRTVAARRTETSVWRSFEGDQPQLFGFLLDLLAEVLRNIEAVQRKIEAGELRVPRGEGRFQTFLALWDSTLRTIEEPINRSACPSPRSAYASRREGGNR